MKEKVYFKLSKWSENSKLWNVKKRSMKMKRKWKRCFTDETDEKSIKDKRWMIFWDWLFSSVAQLCLTLRHHGLQHARLPYPSPTPRAYSNSCPWSRWCHPTISCSVVPFSSHLQSFPASGSFQMSQFFTSGGQSIGISSSASVLPMNIQDWFSLGLTGLISLQSKGLSRVFSNTTVLQCSAFFMVQLSHPYMTTGKTIALTR